MRGRRRKQTVFQYCSVTVKWLMLCCSALLYIYVKIIEQHTTVCRSLTTFYTCINVYSFLRGSLWKRKD